MWSVVLHLDAGLVLRVQLLVNRSQLVGQMIEGVGLLPVGEFRADADVELMRHERFGVAFEALEFPCAIRVHAASTNGVERFQRRESVPYLAGRTPNAELASNHFPFDADDEGSRRITLAVHPLDS